MGNVDRIRIETDRGVARAILRHGTETNRALLARANLVGIHYRRLGRQEFDKDSPFEGSGGRSVLDPGAFRATVRGDEIVLEIRAQAAPFVEEGNEPGPIRPKGEALAIPVKSSRVRRSRGKRGKTRFSLPDGARVVRRGGRYFLMTRSVRAVPGKHLLRRAVNIAFRI